MSNPSRNISFLVEDRAIALGITKIEVVRRCGFKNIAKGLRRLDELRAGDFSRARYLLEALPKALGIEPSLFDDAINATQDALKGEEEKRYVEDFKPHAVIHGERKLPEPIWLLALIGVDRIIRLDFEQGSAPLTFVEQAKRGLKERLKEWNSDVLPCFGRPTGFVVNYDPDKAIEFDLDGRPLRKLEQTSPPGIAFSTVPRFASE